MSLGPIRVFFFCLCGFAGFAVSQSWPGVIHGGVYGVMFGLGLGGLVVGVDHILKGFTLRAFTAATFGLLIGHFAAILIDGHELFVYGADERTRWTIRLVLFLSFGYLGMILAMRGNKEDFSLIIPYVRFRSQNKPENLVLLDTSVIIDGRIAELVERRFVEGILVVPKFVLREIQFIADSADESRRARGRRGLEMLNRLQQNPRLEVRVHEMDFSDETEVDAKLIRLARVLEAKLYTNDYNLGQIAQLQSIPCINLHDLALALKPAVLAGDGLSLRLVREGKERGQAIGYLPDGTMVIVGHAQGCVGQTVQAQVQSVLQTGAGVIIFAELKTAAAA